VVKVAIRQPIICMLGHVDSGKTSLLDCIRKTTIQKKEAGGITQHIGATEVPIEAITNLCSDLIRKMKLDLKIPGLLFIDTPGHEAFTNLRKRGGSIADLAILVVDATEGFQPQTRESIEILKTFKTPFVIALNKIDRLPGWRSNECYCFADSHKKQSQNAKQYLMNRVYDIMGELNRFGFKSDTYENVDDYQKEIAIIPVSAASGEGIGELLITLSGLAQRYLEGRLEVDVKGMTRGTVLEVKEEQGLGKTIDVIIYDGKIDEGDTIVIGALPEPVVTKVRSILKPKPMRELLESTSKFQRIKSVEAAAGLKIAAPKLDGVIAGMPIFEASEQGVEKVKEMIEQDINKVLIHGREGIVVKADSLGSLEALTEMLEKQGIPILSADIGDISKKDIIEAENMKKGDQFLGVIMAFNVGVLSEAKEMAKSLEIPLFSSNIIYHLLDDYEEWKKEAMEAKRKRDLDEAVYPVELQFLPGFLFRQSKPAIFGVEVVAGKLKTGSSLITEDGANAGRVKAIQDSGKAMREAEKGMKVALSVDGITIGKDLNEGDTLYSDLNERDYNRLKGLKDFLKPEEIEIVKRVHAIKRKKNPLWGMK
jgi:translation initiation factor 5B